MRTGALICAIAILARAAVHAGLGVALVDVMLAVAAREAGQAQTAERVDAVHTSTAVKTRAVRNITN